MRWHLLAVVVSTKAQEHVFSLYCAGEAPLPAEARHACRNACSRTRTRVGRRPRRRHARVAERSMHAGERALLLAARARLLRTRAAGGVRVARACARAACGAAVRGEGGVTRSAHGMLRGLGGGGGHARRSNAWTNRCMVCCANTRAVSPRRRQRVHRASASRPIRFRFCGVPQRPPHSLLRTATGPLCLLLSRYLSSTFGSARGARTRQASRDAPSRAAKSDALCSALNSSDASLPAYARMTFLPPGWSGMNWRARGASDLQLSRQRRSVVRRSVAASAPPSRRTPCR